MSRDFFDTLFKQNVVCGRKSQLCVTYVQKNF